MAPGEAWLQVTPRLRRAGPGGLVSGGEKSRRRSHPPQGPIKEAYAGESE